MKLIKQTQEYNRYDLETTPKTMVIISEEGIVNLEQNDNHITVIINELRGLISYHDKLKKK